MSSPSPVRLTITSALLSGLSALTLVWPAELHALDPEALAEAANGVELAPNAMRFGDLLASSELVTDEKTHRHFIRLVVENTSKEREADAKLEVNVLKWDSMPQARVEAPPELAYERTFRISLPPGERDVRELPVGAELARSLDAMHRRTEQAALDSDAPFVYRSYEALVRVPVEAESPPDAEVVPSLAQRG
jgi:hypothetical protein